jgi:F0F1-type ATP synthase delta subunit
MRIAEAQLARAVYELAKEDKIRREAVILATLGLLRRRKFARRTGKLVRALEEYVERETRSISVTITTAFAADAARRTVLEKLAERLFRREGERLALSFAEDRTAIGGPRLESRDVRYDFSLARTLSRLRKTL